jgi:hypothetical protein
MESNGTPVHFTLFYFSRVVSYLYFSNPLRGIGSIVSPTERGIKGTYKAEGLVNQLYTCKVLRTEALLTSLDINEAIYQVTLNNNFCELCR